MTSRFIRDYADNQITLLKQVGDVATLMDFIDVSRNTNINSLLLPWFVGYGRAFGAPCGGVADIEQPNLV
jgi:hypothetical protein